MKKGSFDYKSKKEMFFENLWVHTNSRGVRQYSVYFTTASLTTVKVLQIKRSL